MDNNLNVIEYKSVKSNNNTKNQNIISNYNLMRLEQTEINMNAQSIAGQNFPHRLGV